MKHNLLLPSDEIAGGRVGEGEGSDGLIVGARKGLQSVDDVLPVTCTGMDVPLGQGVHALLPAATLYEPDEHSEQVRKPSAVLPPKPDEHMQEVLLSQVKPLKNLRPPIDLALLEMDTLLRGSPTNALGSRAREGLIAKIKEVRFEHP